MIKQFFNVFPFLSQKAAKFFGSKKTRRSIVVCFRSQISASNFLDVQTFVAIEVTYVQLHRNKVGINKLVVKDIIPKENVAII